jgi:predicted MarR family transcription regulator
MVLHQIISFALMKASNAFAEWNARELKTVRI